MEIPTLAELQRMQHTMQQMERDAEQAKQRAGILRKCGGHKSIFDWHRSRTNGYDSRDYDGITKLLDEAMAEFGPAILEILAKRQDLIAHEAMTQAVMKRAELGSFVSLGDPT